VTAATCVSRPLHTCHPVEHSACADISSMNPVHLPAHAAIVGNSVTSVKPSRGPLGQPASVQIAPAQYCVTQSPLAPHFLPTTHAGHVPPPQSTSVSAPFLA
jgi:hypothetical protein